LHTIMDEGNRTEEFQPAFAGEFLYGTYRTFAGTNEVRCATRKGVGVREAALWADE